jgi:hypothetical protein
MKRYIEKMQNERTPHERREAAIRIASLITAIAFVGWLTTLGFRLSEKNAQTAGANTQTTANTLMAVQGTDPLDNSTLNQ